MSNVHPTFGINEARYLRVIVARDLGTLSNKELNGMDFIEHQRELLAGILDELTSSIKAARHA